MGHNDTVGLGPLYRYMEDIAMAKGGTQGQLHCKYRAGPHYSPYEPEAMERDRVDDY